MRLALRNAGIAALVVSTLAAVAAVPAIAASGEAFDSVVVGIEHEFSIHSRRFPMPNFASGLARVVTWGGVKRVRMAKFENVGSGVNADALESVIRDTLGSSWHPFVTDRNRESGEATFIFEHPSHRSMLLMIANLDNSELSLIQVKLGEKRLEAWLSHPGASLRGR